MSGIYIHIPYCKQACHYCDFHFSTNLSTRTQLIDALCQEIALQKDFLPENSVNTIYFGGGTPSLLSQHELQQLLKTVHRHFSVTQDCEITLEANPDDLSRDTLLMLKQEGINRLSIGIQSFNDSFLKLFNRAHDAKMALSSVNTARKVGFENISVDLIYGIPEQTIGDFRTDLDKMIALQTEHISIYGLTIEEQTVFGKWYQKNKLTPLDEETAAQQFEMIINELPKAGFRQYEISNFCREGFESKHNSSYWYGVPYLGIGPGAHSYNGHQRQYNVSHNIRYIQALQQGNIPFEKELLTTSQQINEIILTQIRTEQGIDLKQLIDRFDFDLMKNHPDKLSALQQRGLITCNERLKLTPAGRLLADGITESLIIF